MFPAQDEEPVRLDFYGDNVEDIRVISVATQRSEDPVDRLIAYPAREVRPVGTLLDRVSELVATEPWAASTWDRIGQGQIFPGIESWLPWLADPVTLIDATPPGTRLVVIEPARAMDRARELIKEETELAKALAPTWGEQAPSAGAHPALFLDLEQRLGDRSHLRLPAAPTGPSDPVMEVRALDATPGDPEAVTRGSGAAAGAGDHHRGRHGRGRGRRPGGQGPG